MSNQTRTEEFKINGDGAVKKIKELIHEGNVRRITIKDSEGKTIAEFPLNIGVVGVLLAPTLAAIGAITALLTECTIAVERDS